MSLITFLRKSAETDLAHALAWYERTLAPEWHDLVLKLQSQVDDYRHAE